jgi:hypothetical protein
MTFRTRPRAPWYSSGTRRLAIVRVGLPTLLVCVFAAGPIASAKTPSLMPPRAAALVAHVTIVARRALDPPHAGHRADGRRQRSDDPR